MDKKAQLKTRAVKFLALFGIACLIMMFIRMARLGAFNPLRDPAASYALGIGLVSYILSKVLDRVL